MVEGLGGIAIGVLVGVAIVQLRARLREPAVEITIGLLTPWAAYLPAEHLNVSGVLAAVWPACVLAGLRRESWIRRRVSVRAPSGTW